MGLGRAVVSAHTNHSLCERRRIRLALRLLQMARVLPGQLATRGEHRHRFAHRSEVRDQEQLPAEISYGPVRLGLVLWPDFCRPPQTPGRKLLSRLRGLPQRQTAQLDL